MTVMVHLSITEYNWYSEILFGTSQFVMIVEETVEVTILAKSQLSSLGSIEYTFEIFDLILRRQFL